MADYNFTIVEEVTNINITPPTTEEVNIEVTITENINNFGESAGVDLSAYQKKADADLKYAVKNHTHAYSELTGLPTLFSGNYNDLTNKPTIPSMAGYATETWATGQFQPKGNYLTSVTWNDVSGKPTSFAPSAHSHPISEVTGLQTALDSKSASTHTHDSITNQNGGTALKLWTGTQAQYDALTTKDTTGAVIYNIYG